MLLKLFRNKSYSSVDIREMLSKTSLKKDESLLLLSKALGTNTEKLITHPETRLSLKQLNKFNQYEKKRLNGLPLAYILGYKYFYNLKLLVNKNVLIPRPETELIIDMVLENIKTSIAEYENLLILDVGCGSGAISLSIAKEIENANNSEKIKIVASDISNMALKVARINHRENNIKKDIVFRKGSLLKPCLPAINKLNENDYLIICANLPYLKATEMNEPSIKSEPKLALISGEDGLEHYRSLFNEIATVIKRKSIKYQIICEMNPGQVISFQTMANNKLAGDIKINILKDLRGIQRFVVVSN